MAQPTVTVPSPEAVAAGLARVRERVAQAAERAGRAPAAVRIIGVSKTFGPEAIVVAVRGGLQDIGENRVQEALPKAAAVAAGGVHPHWHLVGHLQTNKVKQALSLFSVVESVDSLHVARSLSAHASEPLEVLLEVNVAGESTKYGFAPGEALGAVEAIAVMPHLVVKGLMTVAPAVDDPEDVRPVFRRLHDLGAAAGLPELSMGMSGDFEVAISEGATMVRIGRAIFGARE